MLFLTTVLIRLSYAFVCVYSSLINTYKKMSLPSFFRFSFLRKKEGDRSCRSYQEGSIRGSRWLVNFHEARKKNLERSSPWQIGVG